MRHSAPGSCHFLKGKNKLGPRACSHVLSPPSRLPPQGLVHGLGNSLEAGLATTAGWWCPEQQLCSGQAQAQPQTQLVLTRLFIEASLAAPRWGPQSLSDWETFKRLSLETGKRNSLRSSDVMSHWGGKKHCSGSDQGRALAGLFETLSRTAPREKRACNVIKGGKTFRRTKD